MSDAINTSLPRIIDPKVLAAIGRVAVPPANSPLTIRFVPAINRSVAFNDGDLMKLGRPPVLMTMGGSAPPMFSLPIDWAKAFPFASYANDIYGDCMYAAAEHGDNTFTANNGAESSFNDDETVRSYLALSPDNHGLNAGQIIDAWKSGLNGSPIAKIMDAIGLDPTNATLMQHTIWLFGGVFFMLKVPDAWEGTGDGGVWDAPATPNPKSGHGVWLNGVDAAGRYRLQTWGGSRWLTPAGLAACDPTAFAVFSRRWFDSNGKAPNGLTYDQLAALWTSMGGRQLPAWPRPAAQGDRLHADEGLVMGAQLASADGRFRLIFQADGNLVLYGPGHQAMWASGTNGHLNAYDAIMQADGNLVIYDGGNHAIWASGTVGHNGAWLVVQNDGNLVMYGPDNRAVWATNTVVPPLPTTPTQHDRLTANQGLGAGGVLMSADGRFQLAMQADANLVLYGLSHQVLWASNTQNHGSVWELVMQGDGNLVAYDIHHSVVWAAGTDGHGGAWAVLQNDGNFVIYGADGRALWATNTVISGQPAAPTHPDRLLPGEGLIPGHSLRSADGRFTFVLQGDGNLVLYAPGGTALWASNSDGHPDTGDVIMQFDGNLVVYGLHSNARWAAGTAGKPGAWLLVQNDGNVVVYGTDNRALWATNTVVPVSPAGPNQKDRLLPGQGLTAGMSITSNSGSFKLILQGDGNLVLYSYGHAIWATGTDGHHTWQAVMQADGNFVLYDVHQHPVWASNTAGHPGSILVMQDDTNLVVYAPGNQAVWASDTQGKR